MGSCEGLTLVLCPFESKGRGLPDILIFFSRIEGI